MCLPPTQVQGGHGGSRVGFGQRRGAGIRGGAVWEGKVSGDALHSGHRAATGRGRGGGFGGR